ncbi:hypothetical protein CRG98_015920, partial [Punica granatum]
IHEYMLSKAPPVPEVSDDVTSKENNSNLATEGQTTMLADEPVHQAPADEQLQIIPAPADRNNFEEEQPSRELPARDLRSQSLPQPVQQQQATVQKPADDRLFTLAAVGLALAIMVLLLKKFIKSNGHGAVFMDGS